MPAFRGAFLAICLLFGATGAGRAATFDLTGIAPGSTAPSITSSGITLTFSNASPSAEFFTDTDGIGVLAFGAITTATFQMSFSSAVRLVSFVVGFVQTLDGAETLTFSTPANSFLQSGPFAAGSSNFASALEVGAGEAISVVADFGAAFSLDLIQFRTITVEAITSVPVPEPASALLLAGALAALTAAGGLRRRNRAA